MGKQKEPCEHQRDNIELLAPSRDSEVQPLDPTSEKPRDIPRAAKWVNSRSFAKKGISYVFSSKEDRTRAQGERAEDDATRPAIPECEICKEDTRRRRKYRWKLILTLLLPSFMNSLDLTIIATAVPLIASDF
ncbi:hypothetical protein TWF703_003583, partial [Orbilia oligospora]